MVFLERHFDGGGNAHQGVGGRDDRACAGEAVEDGITGANAAPEEVCIELPWLFRPEPGGLHSGDAEDDVGSDACCFAIPFDSVDDTFITATRPILRARQHSNIPLFPNNGGGPHIPAGKLHCEAHLVEVANVAEDVCVRLRLCYAIRVLCERVKE